MKLEIRIEKKHLAYLVFSAAVLVAINFAIAQTPNPGHAWGEIDCSGCVQEAHLADDSVTGSKIPDGSVTDAKIASLAWSKLSSVPEGLSDGDNNDIITCDWTGAKTVQSNDETRSCSSCCSPSQMCIGGCTQSRTNIISTTCSSSIVTNMAYSTGIWGTCRCSGNCMDLNF